MATTVREPYYKSGTTTDRVEQTTPSVETKTTTVAPPSPEAQQYIEQNIAAPLRKHYGINPDGTSTPFQVLGYKPEDRQAEIARQRELEAWKQKEAGIYNGIALAVDAMTAGIGGDVQRRDVGNQAAEAAARQEQLKLLDQQQSAAEQEKLRQNASTYHGLLNKFTEDFLQKQTTTQKTGGQKLVHETTSPESGYRTHAFKGDGDSDGNGSGGNGKKYLFTTTLTGGVNAGQHRQHELTEQQYKNVAGVLLARYKSILNDPSLNQQYKDGMKEKLKSAGILDDSNSVEKWNTDQIMRNGLFWGLTQGDRDLINQFTDGKVTFKTPNNGGY